MGFRQIWIEKEVSVQDINLIHEVADWKRKHLYMEIFIIQKHKLFQQQLKILELKS